MTMAALATLENYTSLTDVAVFTLLSGFAEEPLAIAAGWHLNLAGIG